MSRQHELPGRKTIGYPTNRSAQFLRRKRVQRGNSNYRRAKFEHLESRDCLAFSLTITGTGLVFTGTKGNDTLWGIEYDTTPPAHDSIIFSSDGGPLASRRIKEVPKGFANSVTPISIDIVGYDGKDKVAFQDLGFPFLAGDLQGFPPASIAQISFYGMEGNDVMDTSTIPKNPAASPIVAVGIGGVPNIRFYGGPRFDELIGGILPELFEAGPGNDIAHSGNGNDWLRGGPDQDQLFGELGDDLINGGSASDYRLDGGPGRDTIAGGPGLDDIYGGPGNDIISGGDGDDTIYGGTGDDEITGGNGSDVIRGEDGDDSISTGASGSEEVSDPDAPGGPWFEIVFGHEGWDSITADPLSGAMYVDGGDGPDTIQGGPAADEIHGRAGRDNLVGGLGADKIYGEEDDDWIEGTGQSSELFGGANNDRIWGGLGPDTIDGGENEDIIWSAPENAVGGRVDQPFNGVGPNPTFPDMGGSGGDGCDDVDGHSDDPVGTCTRRPTVYDERTWAAVNEQVNPIGFDWPGYHFVLVQDVVYGSLAYNLDGSFAYTPPVGKSGVDHFTFQAIDNNGVYDSNVATFTIKVGDWDIAPPEKSFTAPKGGNNQLNVPAPGLLQDLNGADEAQLVEGAGPAHGTLVLNLDGSFSYTPDPDYVGTDSFAFKATNTSNNEESGPLIVEIEVPDYSTRGFIDEYEVQAGATLTDDDLGVLWNDQWANTAYVTSYPYNGSLNLNSDGSFEYVPNYGFTGTDTFKYFAVETGTWQQSSPTMVSIYVSPVVAADDVYLLSTAATSLNVSAPGVLANDSGADTVELVEDDGPYFGTLTLNPDGSLEYVPESGFIGTDYFTYRAFNSVSGDWSVPIGVEIVVGPRAVEDEYSVAANGSLNIASPGVLANDNQADGVYLAVDGEPQHGTLTLNADGSFTYVPDTGYSGDDYFVYVATDSATMTESPAGLVTIHVIQPVGTADSYIATEGQLLEQWAPGVLSNDQFADAAVLVGGSGPSHGTLNFSGDGSFTYTPTASYVGSDSFQYRAKDTLTGALSSPATVSFQVYNRPIATADSYAAASGIALASGSPGVLGNDQYANQVQLVAYPQHGSLTLNWWGSFTYTSTALYEGPDSFTYQAIHPVTGALSEPATVSIEVTYYPPAASDDEYWTPSDTPLYASTVSTGVLGNDQWVNRAQLQTGPNYGNLTLFNDGRFIYTPSGVTATDSFTYAAYHTTAGGWVTATAYIYVYSPLALDQAAAEGSSEPSLQVSELQAMSEVAIGYWLAAGVDDETLAARLAGLQFSIVDLPASHLGGSTGDGRIAIDVNAAGYGWFIDASALEHSEFANQTTPTEYRALNGSAAAGMADLLSVLIHEIGHELGLDHLEDSGDGNVMTGTIGLGTRRLPTAEDALLVDLLFQQGYSSRRRR